MEYISKEQLDKEIKHPTVSDTRGGSIAKFIIPHNRLIDDNYYNRSGIEASRPITTKAFTSDNLIFHFIT